MELARLMAIWQILLYVYCLFGWCFGFVVYLGSEHWKRPVDKIFTGLIIVLMPILFPFFFIAWYVEDKKSERDHAARRAEFDKYHEQQRF